MKVWLYWGLKQNGDDTLLAANHHQAFESKEQAERAAQELIIWCQNRFSE